MRSRSSAIPALLAVTAPVLLPAVSNIEANALSSSCTPYLWVAWPADLGLAVPLDYLDVRSLARVLVGTLGGALAGGFAGRIGYGWVGRSPSP